MNNLIRRIAAAGCAPLLGFAVDSAFAQSTLAHWNFDAGTAGVSLSAVPAADQSGNAHLILGYDETLSPTYSTDTATGTGLCCRAKAPQDGYTIDPTINNWSPLMWTIEVSVRLDQIAGWNTIIGRDGSRWPENLRSDFYFQKNGINDRFRLDFATVDGSRYMIESNYAVVAGVWYHVALVSNGTLVEMYIDRGDGEGYRLTASTALSRQPGANNALAASGANWIFGRGWFEGKYVDHINGCMDDIRFTNGALPPSQFLHAADLEHARSILEVARNGHDVSLAWSQPASTTRRIKLYRHDREDAAERTLIATLYPPTRTYLDQVPQVKSRYWYWMVVTATNGQERTLGPTPTTSGEVWTP